MKIYVGKNKKQAKEISLKELIAKCLKSEDCEVLDIDRFSDDSASWLSLRKDNKKYVIDLQFDFDVEDDNIIEGFEIWKSNYVLDEENMKKII
jgi:ribose 5-phosphate isomerase RpiB